MDIFCASYWCWIRNSSPKLTIPKELWDYKQRFSALLSRESFFGESILILLSFRLIAIATINGFISGWLKRNHRIRSASMAYRRIHFPFGPSLEPASGIPSTGVLFLFGRPALRAPSRFISKSLFGEKILLAGSKGEVVTAVFRYECFVLKHIKTSILSPVGYFLPFPRAYNTGGNFAHMRFKICRPNYYVPKFRHLFSIP